MTSSREKQALFGRFGVGALGRLGARRFAPMGHKVENWAAQQIGRLGGQGAEQTARRVLRGTGAEVGRQLGEGMWFNVIPGAAFGALEGAANAEPGDRLSGAAKGAIGGAAMGQLTGMGYDALQGGLMRPLRNARVLGAERAFTQLGHANPAAAALEHYDKPFFAHAHDLATGKGALGRAGSGKAMLGSLGETAATVGVPMMLFGGVTPEEPQQQVRTAAAQEQDPAVEPIVGSLLGGQLGNFAGNYALDELEPILKNHEDIAALHPRYRQYLQKPAVRRLLPGLLGAATAYGGYKGIKHWNETHQPQPADPALEKLRNLDLNALEYYFGKGPQGPTPGA